MNSFFVLLADGMHDAAAPDPSLVSTIFGLTTTFFGLVAFAVALRRGSGPYGRGSTRGAFAVKRASGRALERRSGAGVASPPVAQQNKDREAEDDQDGN
jgi:hypothetical protein